MPLKKKTPITTNVSIKKIEKENNIVNAGNIGVSIDLKSIDIDEKAYWTINKSEKK